MKQIRISDMTMKQKSSELSLSFKEKIELAKEICKDTGVKYVSIVPSDSLDDALLDSVVSVPATFFLDEDGKQLDRNFIGSRSYEGWQAIVDSIYAELDKE